MKRSKLLDAAFLAAGVTFLMFLIARAASMILFG
jgi:hypothetical protein